MTTPHPATRSENKVLASGTVRVYSASPHRFFYRAKTLVCTSPSIEKWSENETKYQRALRASIEKLREHFKACYVAELKRNRATAGSSCVGFVVNKEGGVDQIEAASGVLPVELLDCVLLSVARVQLPVSPLGKVRVMLPLTFVKEGR